ncbi:MAG: methylenetetrahydrofolate reductase C-terminal domain-containing protein [Candidatus Thermoplasmatota archaeon]|nr:methylenetetrahydrofolate reductase C-terminal domain-containing protein [Candidatus Thermoplasmatota archaeon]MBS3802243.1 methylenetetrahydrofolate reductase C-terminal domain-containing protein [Candidatus Thermoplasmatota archaeon]
MIISEQKPFDELLKKIGRRSVFLFGCSECATLCHSGGKRELLKLKKKLIAAHVNVTGWVVLEPACSLTNNEKIFEQYKDQIEQADALAVFACGDGTQVVNSLFPKKSVISGTNTLFLGVKSTITSYERRCNMCGTCIVDEFNGICPITRCPKHMLNGPCGGSEKGNCEVYPDMPCVWEEIKEKAKKLGNYHLIFLNVQPAHDWSQSQVLKKER